MKRHKDAKRRAAANISGESGNRLFHNWIKTSKICSNATTVCALYPQNFSILRKVTYACKMCDFQCILLRIYIVSGMVTDKFIQKVLGIKTCRVYCVVHIIELKIDNVKWWYSSCIISTFYLIPVCSYGCIFILTSMFSFTFYLLSSLLLS